MGIVGTCIGRNDYFSWDSWANAVQSSMAYYSVKDYRINGVSLVSCAPDYDSSFKKYFGPRKDTEGLSRVQVVRLAFDEDTQSVEMHTCEDVRPGVMGWTCRKVNPCGPNFYSKHWDCYMYGLFVVKAK